MIDRSTVNILVVDDEPLMLVMHAGFLANLGYTAATTCEGAVRALEVINNAVRPPDLILLDLNMPELDGVEFVRCLGNRGYSGSLILASGEDERTLQSVEKLAQAQGITTLGYLHKPINPAMLAALLEKWTPAAESEHWTPIGLDDTTAPKKVYTADEVREAITNGEFVNYYQPKVSLTSGRVVGVEALVRWKHPVDGLVFPDQFIGVAETQGLIQTLTCIVIAGALANIRPWRQATGLPLHVAINVSMNDLSDLDFADYVAGAATAAGVTPKDVTLEVAESKLMLDLRAPLEVLARLRLKRFRLSIDHFGTGNSSLAQLRELPFDEMKIDRGFVHGACTDDKVRAIFDASVTLAKQLGMNIEAEGVEDRADWNYVRRAKCDTAQGYFIAKPMPAESVQDWIEDWEERAAALPEP